MDPAGTAHDVLVIGAGLYGISFARTYLTLHPTSTLLILESSHSVGGPWSSERMYDAFWTQNTLGTMEWSDYPLEDVPEAEVWRGFFPARYVAEYLERYVRREGFGGGSILERVRFGVKVLGVERGGEGGWKVRVQSTGGGGGAEGESVMLARKLVVASGLTSVPALPSLPGLEHFAGKVLHHHDLGSWERELELAASTRDSKEAPASRTVVLGGARSALDAVMTAHAHSHHTTWLLRRTSTSGPAGSYPPSPNPQGSLQNPSDPWHVPALAALTPCIFTPEGQRWSAFLQRTRLGRRLVRLVFGDADKRYARDCLRLPSTPSTRTPSANPSSGITTGLSALKPSRNAFWGASSAGPASNPAIWPTLQSGAVQIMRADLQRVVPEGLLLEDGTLLEAETIVCGTGWVPGVERVFGEELAQELGLRGAKGGEGGEWEEEDGRAREYVLGRFPILAEADPVGTGAVAEKQTAPYRLYRGIVPLADPSHSIVFLGLVKIINSFRTSEVQALWASAYLDGSFHHPPSLPKTSKPSSPSPSAAPFWPDLAARRTDVARCVQWSYLRYPDSRGKAGGLGMALDGLAYTGVLLRDLGLGSLEDGKSWWGSWIGLVWAGDLRGLVAEYRAKSQGACKACGISWGL